MPRSCRAVLYLYRKSFGPGLTSAVQSSLCRSSGATWRCQRWYLPNLWATVRHSWTTRVRCPSCDPVFSKLSIEWENMITIRFQRARS